MNIQAGAYHYNKMPTSVFDEDWQVGDEPALRWFCRACGETDELTDHQASGKPQYDPLREVTTRKDYMQTINTGECSSTTHGVYFTPNLFYKWRNQKQLFGFVAHWIEIDTKNHNALTPQASQRVLDEVAQVLWLADIPMATNIVTTGSGGVHLYWLYDCAQLTQSAKHREILITRWREISRQLTSRFDAQRKQLGYKDWFVDFAASHNPSGNMRLPGSLHHKTWRSVDYYRGGKTFSPQALVDELGLKWKYPKNAPASLEKGNSVNSKPKSQSTQRRASEIKPKLNTAQQVPKKLPGIAQGYDSIGQKCWLTQIITQWVQYLSKEQPNLKGQRDLTAFHLFNCANRVMDPSAAWQFIQEINQKYIGLSAQELKSYLSTAATTTYYYGFTRLKKILSDELKLPINFTQTRKKKTLSAGQKAAKQKMAARHTNKAKAQTTLDKLCKEVTQYIKNNNLSLYQIKESPKLKTNLQKRSQLSKATFYRYIDKAIQQATKQIKVKLNDLIALSKTTCLNRYSHSYNALAKPYFLFGLVGTSSWFLSRFNGLYFKPPD
ncbi:hypothetical protein [Pseudoalteromonas umbrosa]|uniref:hypothetical protein n=1 Tax=Pseudoalteromonas umbrosa TaxID=3048489 RepID=UPI0024C35371|nr:hypothetical protein [Pseudoalteromonas sp. B95]MDK1290064.1 hypothetical protein [Pseudoalteromonas sp. B95]